MISPYTILHIYLFLYLQWSRGIHFHFMRPVIHVFSPPDLYSVSSLTHPFIMVIPVHGAIDHQLRAVVTVSVKYNNNNYAGKPTTSFNPMYMLFGSGNTAQIAFTT